MSNWVTVALCIVAAGLATINWWAGLPASHYNAIAGWVTAAIWAALAGHERRSRT